MRLRTALLPILLWAVADRAAATTVTPSHTVTPTPSPTSTVTCGPTATPYCADQCVPCPTVRAGCYADACGECHENPTCGAGEFCEPMGFGGCCACVPVGGTATATPTPSPTPLPCAGDCNRDGAIGIDELVAAVNEALGRSRSDACPSFDQDGDGMVSIAEIVSLVVSALQGCPATLFAGVPGVYDVDGTQTSDGESIEIGGLATVAPSQDGISFHIEFSVLDTLYVGAVADGNGQLRLTGTGIEGGDIVFGATGTATWTRDDQTIRFAALITIDSFVSGMRHLSLTIAHPAAGTPQTFSGTYRLQLHHDDFGTGPAFDSHIDLPITVPPSGLARCGATSDVGDNGNTLAYLAESDCRVSPEGRFSYRTPYYGSDAWLQLTGGLRGGGTFWIASFPLVRGHGVWTAVPPPP